MRWTKNCVEPDLREILRRVWRLLASADHQNLTDREGRGAELASLIKRRAAAVI
jgi:hypothetical protein